MEKPSLMKENRESSFANLLWVILLVGIVVFGGYLRTLGMDWDDGEYLHPDERFLTFVVSSIQPNENPREFFNTQLSTMNPGNVGYRFYVYGTLPLFVNRFVSDFLSNSGLDITLLGREATGWNMYLTGRYISAVLDTFTIVITFLIGLKLLKKLWAAVLAAGLYAFTALPIQLSHYFTVDIMANFFSMAAVYFAVLVMQGDSDKSIMAEEDDDRFLTRLGIYTWRHRADFGYFVLFGISFGLAMACKISVIPIALLIVVAAIVRFFKLSQAERDYVIPLLIFGVAFAGIISFLAFRIGQPYAFNGPGFLGMVPDKAWIETLQNLQGQSKGLVDFPPALQWSRRPITFGFKNLTVWGLGLPLGIAAWAAFLWMSIQILRGKWKEHLLIWIITAIFFVWQSVNFTSSMRYYLQIYATLAIIGAWGCWRLFGYFKANKPKLLFLPIVITAIVFMGTLAYGFAFSRIYSRPATRVEASDWYYQNIPGPVNVIIETDEGEKQQVLPYEAGLRIDNDSPAVWSFVAQENMRINQINFDFIRQEYVNEPEHIGIEVSISSDVEGEDVLGYGELWGVFGWEQHQFGSQQVVNFQFPVDLVADQQYFLWVKPAGDDIHVRLSGVAKLLDSSIGMNGSSFIILPEFVEPIKQPQPKHYTIRPMFDGVITQIRIPHIVDATGLGIDQVLDVKMSTGSQQVSASVVSTFAPITDARGEAYVFVFEPGILVNQDDSVQIEFSLGGDGGVVFYGSKQANESSWDDVVPLRRQGYDPFYEVNGVYRTNLNFEMYWNDDESKRERFLTIIDQADIIMMTSNRQWGTTTRVPERYPMTTMYYRELIGCPPDKEVFWCYAVAEPGMFEGNLGYRLKEVFQSNPNIGSIAFNTQFAEEAFTVYDHPKVLVFEKTDDYDRAKVTDLFYAVDLNNVVHMLPADVPLRPKNLLLPAERLAGQRSGGTWADLYPPQSLLNQSPLAAAVVWYLAITLLGVISYPITRIVFSGLQAKGYAVSRMVGLVLFAWFSWMAGSAGIPLTRLAVWLIFAAYTAINVWLFVRNRKLMVEEIKQYKQEILRIEIIGLAFFLAFLLVRLGNPDLWHPYKGGEKPMDFAYLNAVLKSTTFPPYDPWFAGGYINYYYYGFVIVGMPIKALGINPAIAYNLVLASLFSIMGLIAYVIGATITTELFVPLNQERTLKALRNLPLVGGLITATFSLVIGNLGTVQMIFRGFTRLGSGEVSMGFGHQFMALVKGFSNLVSGQSMPFYPGDWYWIPSRMIPGEPITEFPYFTFLYADLHAHLLA
ncbi:MAG TPA: phospholipid carrier-dependent glycosyltransferase, partial [Chloroflexi bacterium]|nr:phospholipid carrier-dependent glycosyltransferase [Chloroflexota bacterium]